MLLDSWRSICDKFKESSFFTKEQEEQNTKKGNFQGMSQLMLQRADAEKTQYSLVGKVGQGIYPQGSDKTHRPDDDRMRGLGTWRHTEGVPHACTAREGIVHA